MKRMSLVFACLFCLLALPPDSPAQMTTGFNPLLSRNGALVEYRGTVTGVQSLTSNYFTFEDFDGESFVTYAPTLIRQLTGDTVYVTTYVIGSHDGQNWFRVDTLATADSVTGWKSGTMNFSNLKFPLYALEVKGDTTTGKFNNKTAGFTVAIYAYKRDPR